MTPSRFLDRRGLLCWCGVGLATGLVASRVEAQAPAGLTRTILNSVEVPGTDYVTLQVRTEVVAGFALPAHTHPGVESTSLVSGGGTLIVRGQPDRVIKGGDVFQIPTGVVHALNNGPEPTFLMSVYVVDKNKPLASPA